MKPGPLASGPREAGMEARKKSRSRAGSSDPWRPLSPGGSMDSWGKPEPLDGRGSRGEGAQKMPPRGVERDSNKHSTPSMPNPNPIKINQKYFQGGLYEYTQTG